MLNFIGSKKRLLPWLTEQIAKKLDGDEKTFCDAMAGTGTVAIEMQKSFEVTANDILATSFFINSAKLNVKPENSDQYLYKLNKVTGVEGFIFKNYAETRKYFIPQNAKKIDGIRLQIIKDLPKISKELATYAVASLLEATDRVANCASVYEAYLKYFKQSAIRPITLEPLNVTWKKSQVFMVEDIELAKFLDVDIVYCDPPYVNRQFGSNYHVLETIAKYDNPEVRGVTGMRDYIKSRWCMKRHAHLALTDFVSAIKARHIFLSYNNEGIMKKDQIQEILSGFGKVDFVEVPHRRFKADSERAQKANNTIEYLFHLRKRT